MPRIAWSSADDPDRAGFEILWRETTDPRWRVYDFVAVSGGTTLEGVSTDNHLLRRAFRGEEWRAFP